MNVKVGMIVRADDGGLGAQTMEIWRHIRPYKTLVMDMSALTRIPSRFDRYPDCPVVDIQAWWNDDRIIEDFVNGCDVIYTAETPYNYRLFRICRRLGVRSVLHANYEFLDFFNEAGLAPPDELWMASSWNYDKIPWQDWGIAHIQQVPTPVDRERCQYRRPTVQQRAKTFLHIAGQETIADRNGTEAVMQAVERVEADVNFVICTQHALGYGSSDPRVTVRHDHLENYWDLYRHGDVLLLPRRYGGQSLQMNEALSVGLPVICTDVEPQNEVLPREWLVSVRHQGQFTAKVLIDYWQPLVDQLASKIEWFASRPLLPESQKADVIAESLSWEFWTDKYLSLLYEVCYGPAEKV